MGPGLAIIGAVAALSGAAPASCPAGVPVQAITVVNQAKVGPFALAKVERAIVDQSMQLRAAWGTPCVQFASGGWKVYLRTGLPAGRGGYGGGFHAFYGAPYAVVFTAASAPAGWSSTLSHEMAEMLANPATNSSVYHDGAGSLIEIADPVESSSYQLDGVDVSDFVLRAWYAGGTTGQPTCATTTCSFPGPLLAPAGDPGPWDQMHILGAPWQVAQRP